MITLTAAGIGVGQHRLARGLHVRDRLRSRVRSLDRAPVRGLKSRGGAADDPGISGNSREIVWALPRRTADDVRRTGRPGRGLFQGSLIYLKI
jgi:hypothetical protein